MKPYLKFIKVLATVFLLAPLAPIVVNLWGVLRNSYKTQQVADREDIAYEIAQFITIHLYATLIGLFIFVIAVFLQCWVAKKSGVYSENIWKLIFFFGILFCLALPEGLLLGVPLIVLLFKLEIFKKMRRGENTFKEQ